MAGSDEERLAAFRTAYAELSRRILPFIASARLAVV